jgi:FkbM family methyltransferase
MKALIKRWLRGPPPSDSPLLAHVHRSELVSPEALIRLGSGYGGWIIPADAGMTPTSVCYLAGAGEDISFDCALAQRYHCRVRIVDPTPRAIEHFRQLQQAVSEGRRLPINNSVSELYDIEAEDLAHLRFLPVGLADQDTELRFYLPRDPNHVSCSTVNLQRTGDYFTAQCYRLATLMGQQGDTELDLLKLDIEGAEYGVIRDVLGAGPVPRILLVEFDEAHTPLDNGAGSRIRDHIRQLVAAGMRCIAVEGSNATFVRRG